MKTTLLLSALALLSACASTPTAPTATTDTAAAATGVKPYPLKTCLVTDNALGSMGDDQRFVYQGQEIKVCCEPCVPKFHKNPAKYLAKLR
jgi:uncharacterized lipoprotein YmbA